MATVQIGNYWYTGTYATSTDLYYLRLRAVRKEERKNKREGLTLIEDDGSKTEGTVE